MTRPYHVSRPAPLTPAERMERKRKVIAQRQAEKEARQEVKQTLKLAGLRYDYGQVEEQHRERVQAAALDILAHGKRAKESIIGMGQGLIDVKALLPEWTFTEWIKAEFELSERMAQNLMNVARQYGERPEIISVLNDTVLYLLSAPSTPQSARDEVEEIAVTEGKSPKVARVQRVVKAHKTPEIISPVLEEIETLPIESKRLAEAGFSLQRYGDKWRYVWQRGDTTSYSALMTHRADVFDAAFAALAGGEAARDTDLIHLAMPRGLVHKLQLGALRNQRFWDALTGDELDRLNIIFSTALKQEGEE